MRSMMLRRYLAGTFFRLGVDGVFTDFTPSAVTARTACLHEIGIA